MVQARTNIGLFSKQYSFASEAILLCGQKYIDTRVEHRKDRRRRLYSRDFVRQHAAPMTFPSDGSSYIILSPIELSIRRKIEAVGKPLKDWDIKIYRGVLTGCNEAFIITTEKRNELLAQCQTEEERQRTAELIRPVSLAHSETSELIYTHPYRIAIHSHSIEVHLPLPQRCKITPLLVRGQTTTALTPNNYWFVDGGSSRQKSI